MNEENDQGEFQCFQKCKKNVDARWTMKANANEQQIRDYCPKGKTLGATNFQFSGPAGGEAGRFKAFLKVDG